MSAKVLSLIRVASYAHLTGKELTNDVVENLLREILQEEGRHTITIEVIQKKVAEKFDLRMVYQSVWHINLRNM